MAHVLILCPTFDHADTLFASTASVRAQAFSDWELVVIGDGAPRQTEIIMSSIAGADCRIRYQPHPKSKRYGESYRDDVIRKSRAEVVMQLGDDDLWAPDHIQRMLDLLGDADWANEAPVRVQPDGTAEWLPINHGTAGVRKSIVDRVPVSAGPNFVAYRRSAYLRLSEGWTCAPGDYPSDAFMWAKFFRQSGLSVASIASTSALKFPSHINGRQGLGPQQRLAELQPWLAKIGRPDFVRDICTGASIRDRMFKLYQIHEVSASASWRDAVQGCGFELVAAREAPARAGNGSLMLLPLSPGQEQDAALAFEKYQRCASS